MSDRDQWDESGFGELERAAWQEAQDEWDAHVRAWEVEERERVEEHE